MLRKFAIFSFFSIFMVIDGILAYEAYNSDLKHNLLVASFWAVLGLFCFGRNWFEFVDKG